MRARTLLDLISLSSNLYMLSKNEALMKTLHELADKGKDKFNAMAESFNGDEEEMQFVHKLMAKAMEAKAEVENKMEEVAVKVYEKMRIAHSDDLKRLEEEVKQLSHALQMAEARLVTLETQNH